MKGWLDERGELHEKVYDVALSDERLPDPQTGAVAPLQSTVDLESASYINSIGDPSPGTVWYDADFDPAQWAFYYARVLEIPTPRWATFNAAFSDTKLPPSLPATIQKRVYSSPIWYSPK